MKTCIICRKEKLEDEFNEEHIIQDSIGGRIKIKDVCKKCNSQLGNKVDIHLTNNVISELIRFFLGIKGKSGKLPNPFKEGILKGEENKRVICDNSLRPKLRPYVEEKYDEGIIKITTESEEESLAIARKRLKRIGKENISDDELTERIISNKQEQFRLEAQYEKTINLNLIALSIIKVAYEISFYWLGKEYLNDVQGIKLSSILSNYINTDKLDNISDVIRGISISLTKEFHENKIAKLFNKDVLDINLNNLHYISLGVEENKLYCTISIWGVFNYQVLISHEPYKYFINNKNLIIYASTGEFIEF